MTDPTMWSRINTNGLKKPADALKEEIRLRLRAEQPSRNITEKKTANVAAEELTWELFRPICDKMEKLKAAAAGSSPDELELVTSYQDADIDSLLDPQYSEADPGRWIRDGLIWTAAEFRRVVSDSHNQATINLHHAKNPPPTAWAIFVLESFARRQPAKRADLISRVLTFANRSTNDQPTAHPKEPQNQDHDFLDTLE